MGKRKHQDEETIRRKIKKLEKRLQKKQRPRRLSSSSSAEDPHIMPIMDLDEEIPMPANVTYTASEFLPQSPTLEPLQLLPITPDQPVQTVDSPVAEMDAAPGPSGMPAVAQKTEPLPSTSKDLPFDDVEDIELDRDILDMLGDAPKVAEELGKPIHKEISSRWSEILLKGLSKDVREKIMDDYLIPSNCQLLLAPALNPEAKAAVVEVVSKRDSSLMFRQKQLGVALTALGRATETLLGSASLIPQKEQVIKPLSDACRILCDLHFNETRTRRNFVLSSINTSLKETLVDTTRDKLLFGDNVTDKLRAAKSIQRSGEALKNSQKPFYKNSFIPKPSFAANNNKNHLNWKSQHRKTPNKSENLQRRPPPSTARQQFRNKQAYHRPSDQPPQGRPQRR